MDARLAFGCLLVAFFACSTPPAEEPLALPAAEDHARQVQAWRIERHTALMQPDGWLSLVGLHFLDEGENTFGSGEAVDVRFPEGRGPASAGAFVLKEGAVRIRCEQGSGVTFSSAPVTEMLLRSDMAGDPTELHLGSVMFFVVERMGKLAIRVKDAESPLFDSFGGLEYFPVDHRWLVAARFEPYGTAKRLEFVDSVGIETVEEVPGALVFERDGATYRIDVRREGDELFVVFGDETNGAGSNGGETYGGGRYIYTPLPDENGFVPLDFNRAYNPPCVFTPYATCPRPTPENRLPIAIRAGEKLYKDAS